MAIYGKFIQYMPFLEFLSGHGSLRCGMTYFHKDQHYKHAKLYDLSMLSKSTRFSGGIINTSVQDLAFSPWHFSYTQTIYVVRKGIHILHSILQRTHCLGCTITIQSINNSGHCKRSLISVTVFK